MLALAVSVERTITTTVAVPGADIEDSEDETEYYLPDRQELATLTGKSLRTVERAMPKLVKLGAVRREDGRRRLQPPPPLLPAFPAGSSLPGQRSRRGEGTARGWSARGPADHALRPRAAGDHPRLHRPQEKNLLRLPPEPVPVAAGQQQASPLLAPRHAQRRPRAVDGESDLRAPARLPEAPRREEGGAAGTG